MFSPAKTIKSLHDSDNAGGPNLRRTKNIFTYRSFERRIFELCTVACNPLCCKYLSTCGAKPNSCQCICAARSPLPAKRCPGTSQLLQRGATTLGVVHPLYFLRPDQQQHLVPALEATSAAR